MIRSWMNWVSIGCALALLPSIAAHAATAATKPLRIGTEGVYPPYNSTTSAGELVGFEIDLMKNICSRMKTSCEFVSLDWNGLIPKLQEGSIDVVMSALSDRADRRKVIDFSLAYFSAPTYFVARKGSSVVYTAPARLIDLGQIDANGKLAIAELARHLKGAVVGVEDASTHADYVNHYYSESGRVRIYPKPESLFLDLAIGRVDAVCSGYANITQFIKEQQARGKEFVRFGPGVRGGVLGNGVALGLRKSDGALRQKVNEAMRAAGGDGTIAKLSVKWFGFDGSVRYEATTAMAASN